MRTVFQIGLLCVAAATGAISAGETRGAEASLIVPEGTLTIERACEIALKNNPQVQQAVESIAAAKEVVAQANSAWWPTVSAYGSYQNVDSSIQPDWQPEFRMRGGHREANAGLQASWLLFDGFAREANILASKYGVNQSEQILIDVRRLLIQSVSTAFHQAQLAVANMAIAQQNRSFNMILEEDARKRWQLGHSSESEMLNFSVRALQAETDFLNAERSFRIACTVLAELMALENAHLPPDLYPESNHELQSGPLPDFDSELRYAVEHRPDLQAITYGIQGLRQRLKSQKGSYSPTIALVGGVDYLNQSDLGPVDQDEHSAFVGITAQWDLFTGGRRPAQVRQIEADIRRLNKQRQEKILSIESSIRQALDVAETAYLTYQRQQKALELTQRIRDHVEKAYKAGTEPLTRLNEAQTDLVRAAGQSVTSRIQYQLALVNLKAETGQILECEVKEVKPGTRHEAAPQPSSVQQKK